MISPARSAPQTFVCPWHEGALVAPSLVVAAWAIGVGLSAIHAAAARYHFQALDFLAHGFVEDGIGQEDKPVRAGRPTRIWLANITGPSSNSTDHKHRPTAMIIL
jgi:predicted ArsR family transcriptional regulator